MPRALLITNPRSRSGAAVQAEIEATLRSMGIDFTDVGACPEPTDLARVLERNPTGQILVAGGDGTLAHVAEALIGKRVKIGIIPTGTANNLARTLSIPQTIPEACRIIADGNSVAIDVGRVNGALFVSVAGVGISTEVHRSVGPGWKRVLGPLSYALEAVRPLLKSPGFRLEITTDRERLRTRAIQLSVCNGKNFGAVLEVREDASVTDQTLDALVIEQESSLRGVLNALLHRPHGRGLRRLLARRLEVRTWPRQPIDVEGRVIASTPATFEVLPGALEVYVPRVAEKAS